MPMTASDATEPAPQLPVTLLALDNDGKHAFTNVATARGSVCAGRGRTLLQLFATNLSIYYVHTLL